MEIPTRREALKQRIHMLLNELALDRDFLGNEKDLFQYFNEEGWPEEVVREVLMEQYKGFPSSIPGLNIEHVWFNMGDYSLTFKSECFEQLTKEEIHHLPHMSIEEVIEMGRRFELSVPNITEEIDSVGGNIHFNICHDLLSFIHFKNGKAYSFIYPNDNETRQRLAWELNIWLIVHGVKRGDGSKGIEFYRLLVDLLPDQVK